MAKAALLFLASAALALAAAPAHAQQPARAPAPPVPSAAPAPDPAMEAAQRLFDALPEAARKQMQDDLIWASNFTATVSGGFGRRTYDAIVNFQRLARLPTTGALDDAQRKTLHEAALRAKAAAKFAPVVDPRSGASLGVPAGLLTTRDQTPTGTRWTSADGAIVLETGVGQGGAAELPAAFERFVTLQAPGRRVTYKLLRPDFFVVSGENGPRSFYIRYGLGPTNLRGYALSYPTARAKELERTVIAVANTFQPIPGAAPAPAVAGAPVAPALPVAPPPPSASLIPPGLILTGVVIGRGQLATSSLALACAELRVGGKPARVAGPADAAGGVIVEADTGNRLALNAISARPGSTAPDAPLIVLGFSGGTSPTLAVTAARLAAAGRIAAPLHRESGGALILDRAGAAIGQIGALKQAPRLIAGLLPAVSHPVIPLPPRAERKGLPPAPMTAGAAVAEYGAALMAISCAGPVSVPKE